MHGFGLGSQFYFNKPLSELDPAEIALLIAVIRGPSYYNPFTHPERARARRDLVLGLMREFGLITAKRTRTAIHQPLALTRSARQGGGYYPAFLDLVREQLGHDYDADRTRVARLSRLHDARTARAGRRGAGGGERRSIESKPTANCRAASSKPALLVATHKPAKSPRSSADAKPASRVSIAR